MPKPELTPLQLAVRQALTEAFAARGINVRACEYPSFAVGITPIHLEIGTCYVRVHGCKNREVGKHRGAKVSYDPEQPIFTYEDPNFIDSIVTKVIGYLKLTAPDEYL